LDTAAVVAILAAILGSGGVLGWVVKTFLALVTALQEDNKSLRRELRLTRREATRANRRIDLFLRAVRGCEHGATCRALEIDLDEVDDEVEEELARAGR
jgi:outer membrane murein-binding lipoprotein Lpp